MGNVSTIRPTETVNFGHQAYDYCIDVVSCVDDIIKGFLVECGQEYNCNKTCAGDCDYFIPIPVDGKLMIQTHFRDPGGMTPSAEEWLIVRLCSDDCVITDNRDQIACRWVHGYEKPRNYQTFELDAEAIASLGVTCFSLEFQDTANDVTLCTQEFKIVECNNLVEIEGVRTGVDCWNDYYGISESFQGTENFAYSNKIYLEGAVKYFGIQQATDDENLTEFVRFYPSTCVAPFMMQYIGNKLLSDADYSLVDGEVYDNDTNSNFSIVEGTSMFLPNIEFSRECDSANSGDGC